EHIQDGLSFVQATRAALQRLEGAFSIVVLCESEPGKILAAKNATPIVIGIGEGENFVASDIPALLDYTRQVAFLDDGEMAEVTRDQVIFSDFQGRPIERAPRQITWDAITAQKGGYKHFLPKEIHEQPQAIIDTMRGRLLVNEGEISLGELEPYGALLDSVK